MMLLRAQRHMRRSRYPQSSPHRSTHTAPFSLCRTSQAATTTRGGLDARAQHIFLVQGSHPLFGRPFPFLLAARRTAPAYEHARTRSALHHARARARTRALARTRKNDRRPTNDATCGPPAWLTGTLHDRGIRSVRSPPRRAPLLATPIATPLQGGRPKRPGLLFLELLDKLECTFRLFSIYGTAM